MVGIVGYGVYIPKWRITVDEIAKAWHRNADEVKQSLLVEEKSVPSADEDATTLAVESARNALRMAREVDPKELGAIYVGSESKPYAVKPMAAIVAEAIGAVPFAMAADAEFACKAATAGMQACVGLVKAGYIKYGMAIGADVAQHPPADPLEYTASAGGAAFLVGNEGVVAEIEGTCSYARDVPDFWRRDGAPYPQHGGRFTGEPGYFAAVVSCARALMEKMGMGPDDYDHVVFHEPNGKFPLRAAAALGFPKEKLLLGLVVGRIGNAYSASSLIGLAAVLDQAKPGQRVLVTSYGSGAGSDAFSLLLTDLLAEKRGRSPTVASFLNHGERIDYATYLRFRGSSG